MGLELHWWICTGVCSAAFPLCVEVFLYSSMKTGSCRISCMGDYCMYIIRCVATYPYTPQHRHVLLVLPLKTLQVVVFSHKVKHYLLRLGLLPQCLHSHALHLEAHIILKCMTQKCEWTLFPFLSRDAYNLTSHPPLQERDMSKHFHFRREADDSVSCAITQKFIQVLDWAIDQTPWGIFYNLGCLWLQNVRAVIYSLCSAGFWYCESMDGD